MIEDSHLQVRLMYQLISFIKIHKHHINIDLFLYSDKIHRRITHRKLDSLPSFEMQTGNTANCDSKANLCLKITYSDGFNDLVSAYQTKWSKGVLNGKLPSNGGKVVIILADEDNSEDTVS